MRQIYAISIHTPTKGVTIPFHPISDLLIDFNPHSHEGSDSSQPQQCHNCSISIHTPTKGVTKPIDRKLDNTTISIHTPTKGVTVKNLEMLNFVVHFNPHSHEGSDDSIWLWNPKSNISIHTPTKGVTHHKVTLVVFHCHFNPHSHEGSDPYCPYSIVFAIISIHTPTKGVTRCTSIQVGNLRKFQSTLPRRE